MKKIKDYLKKIREAYYSFMMDICAENSETARIKYGEESKENLNWIRKYDKYSKKKQL